MFLGGPNKIFFVIVEQLKPRPSAVPRARPPRYDVREPSKKTREKQRNKGAERAERPERHPSSRPPKNKQQKRMHADEE